MKHLEVLVVTEKTIISKILNWKMDTVKCVESAIEKLHQCPYKVVAVSNDIKEIDKLKLAQIISVLFNEVIFVTYNEELSLSETVKSAYWSKNKPRVNRTYLDNSFEIKLANSLNLN